MIKTVKKKKYYEDFVGEELTVDIPVKLIFHVGEPHDILKKELFKKIKTELSYSNGLLCGFEKVKITAHNDIITIKGVVLYCKVDCG